MSGAPPKPPAGLGRAGEALWTSVVGKYDLAAHEGFMLASACRHADLIAELDRVLADGLITTGASGQPRLSAAVAAVTSARLALSRLLADLALPMDDAAPVKLPSPASARARKAANARWNQARLREARRALDPA
jgi:hypothetical protein